MKRWQHLALSLFFFGSLQSFAATFPTELTGPSVIDATPVSVSAAKKSGLVVIFLSSFCPCSNSHMTEINHLKREYPEFAFIGVHSNTNEPKDPTVAYFKQANLDFPVIQDNGAKIADQFKASKTPHAFVVLNSGQVSYQGGITDSNHFESSDRNYLREALEDIKAGRPVRTAQARTLGCAIARGGKNVW